jgi:uncharacterized protein YprB with RNaseH-like and TPR domain
MFSENKLKKLEELAGKLGKGNLQLGADWAKKLQEKPPAEESEPELIIVEEPVAFADTVVGEEVQTPAGKCFYIRKELKTAGAEFAGVAKLYKEVFLLGTGQRLKIKDDDAELSSLIQAEASKVTYLDIETCGVSNASVFLIGWCYFDNDDFITEQVFARHYSEEAAILSLTCDRLRNTQVLGTFNGKKFDLPFILERAAIHGQELPTLPAHVDMLQRARAHWRSMVPNCRLQTLEQLLCHRKRTGDIPSSMIPQAYNDFALTGDARKIKTIIDHNLFDIVTLAELTARLLGGYEPESLF